MYEGMKKQIIAKVEKQIDKEVSDSRSDLMGMCLKCEPFMKNPYLDNLFFKYFSKHGFYLKDDSFESMIKNRIPTRQFLKFSSISELRRSVPKYILKANLEFRYASYYYKFNYEGLVKELKEIK